MVFKKAPEGPWTCDQCGELGRINANGTHECFNPACLKFPYITEENKEKWQALIKKELGVQKSVPRNGWIGVDLDGTLAYYERGDFAKYGATHIGAPVPLMVERVKQWLREGQEVRIITARVGIDGEGGDKERITQWCIQYIGQALPVTCSKDYDMIELWDDRAIQVISNTGKRADEQCIICCGGAP